MKLLYMGESENRREKKNSLRNANRGREDAGRSLLLIHVTPVSSYTLNTANRPRVFEKIGKIVAS